ncbi:hypothetical protein M426DRAFT_258160 [Hypoxylon sp. CI-4A]|nr:hypothetical protein M426DRAFT_258160 [Hypoxylon sp. CI-4A]
MVYSSYLPSPTITRFSEPPGVSRLTDSRDPIPLSTRGRSYEPIESQSLDKVLKRKRDKSASPGLGRASRRGILYPIHRQLTSPPASPKEPEDHVVAILESFNNHPRDRPPDDNWVTVGCERRPGCDNEPQSTSDNIEGIASSFSDYLHRSIRTPESDVISSLTDSEVTDADKAHLDQSTCDNNTGPNGWLKHSFEEDQLDPKDTIAPNWNYTNKHRAWLLNDNQDGTLSVLEERDGSELKIPAEVVSRRPLNHNEPPMVNACLPPSKLKLLETLPHLAPANYHSNGTNRYQQSSTLSPVSLDSVLGNRRSMALWKYIQDRVVIMPLPPISQLDHVPELIRCLSRVRELELNHNMRFPFGEATERDIAAMIIQVSGTKPSRECSACKVEKGPFRGCYTVPAHAPVALRQSILCCANCYYEYDQAGCDLKQWLVKKYPELESIQDSQEVSEPSMAESSVPSRTKLPERRSLRNVLKASKRTSPPRYSFPTPVKPSPKKGPKNSDQSNTPKSTRADNKVTTRVNRRPLSPSPEAEDTSQSAPNVDTSLASEKSSFLDAAQILKVETWEVAPGRIRNEGGDAIDNFAFSNAYLAQNRAVRIGRDVSFQVVTVKPGMIHTWEATPRELRLISIASGKLQVRIHNKEFLIGTNGMVRIRAGVGCTVSNWLYVDAVVHVTVVPSDLC